MAINLDWKSIVNRHKVYDIKEGSVIIKEGEKNLDMYAIAEGHVEMYIGYGTENETLLGILGPGAIFGELGMLTGKPAIYSIAAYSDLKLIRIPENDMAKFIVDNPEQVLFLMQKMANNMISMQKQINQLDEVLSKSKGEEASNQNYAKDNLKNYTFNNSTNDASSSEGKGMRFIK